MITVEYEINGTRYARNINDDSTKSLLEYVSIDACLPYNWLVNNFDTSSCLEILSDLERHNILKVKLIEVI